MIIIFQLFISQCLFHVLFAERTGGCGQLVTALRGDTCEQLRNAFHMTLSQFEQLNPNLDCQHLRPRESKICVATKQQLRDWKSDSGRRCRGPRVKVLRGDTCSKVGARLDVDEEHFRSNNRHVDCNVLSPGDIICGASQSSVEEEAETVGSNHESESSCSNGQQVIEVQEGDTCRSLSRRYWLAVSQIESDNPSLDCRSISAGTRLCIRSSQSSNGDRHRLRDHNDGGDPSQNSDGDTEDTNADDHPSSAQPSRIDTDQDRSVHVRRNATRCPGKFVLAKGNESCANLRDQHNIDSDAEFAALNPTIDCGRGSIERGRVVCIRRPRVTFVHLRFKRPRGIENLQLLAVNCTNFYRITPEDTCWAIRNMARLSEKAFQDLNPGLDCSNLKPGNQVCLKSRTTFSKQCRLTFTIQPGQTCSSIASLAKLTLDQLKKLNPGVDCDRLESKKQLCLSTDDVFDSETRIAGQDEMSADNFLRSASTRLSQRNLQIDAELAQKIRSLLSQGEGAGADSAELVEVLAKPESIALIKAVTESDANFRRLSTEFDQRRSLICLQLTEGQTAYKACVCDNDKPFIHCQAVLLKNLKSAQGREPQRHKRRHAKSRARRNQQRSHAVSNFEARAADASKPIAISSALATVGGSFSEFWIFFQRLCPNCVEQGCLATGACFIIPQAPVFEVCVTGGACLPNPAMLITTGGRITVNQFFSSQINVGVGICITGITAVFKLVGLAACVASVDLRYYYLRQQLELHPQIALVAVRAYLDALVQVGNSKTSNLYDSDNNAPLVDLCLEEAYQCSDFCQLDRGGVTVKYNVEVWFFGWRSVKNGDIKGLPQCRPKTLPPPDTLKRLVVFVSGNSSSGSRPDLCVMHDFSIRDIPTNVGITHVVYAYLGIDPRTFRVTVSGQNQDIEDLGRLKDNGMRLMVSVGGRAFCEDDQTKSIFSNLVGSGTNRRAFVDSITDFLNRRSLHGIDIAWTNPQSSDQSGYLALISEIRDAIDRAGGNFLLSISGPRSLKNFDTAPVHKLLDFFNLMTFDYHEPKDSYKVDAINAHSPVVDCSCSQGGRPGIDPGRVPDRRCPRSEDKSRPGHVRSRFQAGRR